jgi:hypothetical protein
MVVLLVRVVIILTFLVLNYECGRCAMVEAFFLYAFNKESEYSVPVAKLLIVSSDYRFFQENRVVDKNDYFVEWVLKWVKKECPCVLVPFQSEVWEFYLNSESIVYVAGKGDGVDYLPVIDLASAPVGVVI